MQADLVLASIGYRCLPMPGVAFDEATGTIANRCAVDRTGGPCTREREFCCADVAEFVLVGAQQRSNVP